MSKQPSPLHALLALLAGAICEALSSFAQAFNALLLYVQRRRLHAMLRGRLQQLSNDSRADAMPDEARHQQLPPIVAKYLAKHVPPDLSDPVRYVSDTDHVQQPSPLHQELVP